MLKKLYQIYSLVESRMLYQRELLNITKHLRADKICTDQQKTEIREFLTTILIDPKPVWAESELDVFVKTFNNATLNDFKRYYVINSVLRDLIDQIKTNPTVDLSINNWKDSIELVQTITKLYFLIFYFWKEEKFATRSPCYRNFNPEIFERHHLNKIKDKMDKIIPLSIKQWIAFINFDETNSPVLHRFNLIYIKNYLNIAEQFKQVNLAKIVLDSNLEWLEVVWEKHKSELWLLIAEEPRLCELMDFLSAQISKVFYQTGLPASILAYIVKTSTEIIKCFLIEKSLLGNCEVQLMNNLEILYSKQGVAHLSSSIEHLLKLYITMLHISQIFVEIQETCTSQQIQHRSLSKLSNKFNKTTEQLINDAASNHEIKLNSNNNFDSDRYPLNSSEIAKNSLAAIIELIQQEQQQRTTVVWSETQGFATIQGKLSEYNQQFSLTEQKKSSLAIKPDQISLIPRQTILDYRNFTIENHVVSKNFKKIQELMEDNVRKIKYKDAQTMVVALGGRIKFSNSGGSHHRIMFHEKFSDSEQVIAPIVRPHRQQTEIISFGFSTFKKAIAKVLPENWKELDPKINNKLNCNC